MTYIIAQPCVDIKDKSCIEECPVDCIYEGNRMLYIQPDECVDCGACEPVCPVEAIYYEDDVPSQWKDFSKVNTEFSITPKKYNFGLMEIELQDAKGMATVRLTFDSTGTLSAKAGARYKNFMKYKAGEQYDIKIKLDAFTQEKC